MTLPKRSKGCRSFITAFFVAVTTCLAVGAVTSCSNGCEEVRETFCVCDLKGITGASLQRITVWAIGHHAAVAADTVVTETTMTIGDSTAVVRDTLIVAADGGDSLMIDGETSPTNIALILNPDTTVTALRILFTGVELNEPFQAYDTLVVRYEPYPYFLDMECGCSVYFTLREVATTGRFIQNAYIKKSEITNEEAINIVLEY